MVNFWGNLFKRKQYLINLGFQLRYIGFFVGVALVTAFVFLVSAKYTINLNFTPLMESGASHLLTQLIEVEKEFLSKNLLTIFLVLIGIFTLVGIVLTHRIAGPLFALKRRMREISEHGIHSDIAKQKLHIRKYDEFHDVIDTFNDMMTKAEECEKNDQEEKEKR